MTEEQSMQNMQNNVSENIQSTNVNKPNNQNCYVQSEKMHSKDDTVTEDKECDGGLVDPSDFEAWVPIIRKAEEKAAHNKQNAESLGKIYENFLSEFPLCFGYWKKFAKFQTTFEESVEVFKQAVKAIDKSEDLWLAYIKFLEETGYVPLQTVRNVIDEALHAMGSDWTADGIWEKAISFEKAIVANKKYTSEEKEEASSRVSELYVRRIAIPVGDLSNFHSDSVEWLNSLTVPIKMPTKWEFEETNRIISIEKKNYEDKHQTLENFLSQKQKEFEIELSQTPNCHNNESTTSDRLKQDLDFQRIQDSKRNLIVKQAKELRIAYEKEQEIEVARAVRMMLRNKRAQLYQTSIETAVKRAEYEKKIRRNYFHPKPLDTNQVKNWDQYIQFEKSLLSESDSTNAKNQDSSSNSSSSSSSNMYSEVIPKQEFLLNNLYRRCLVSCNNYVSFWADYAEWLETKGLVNEAIGVLKLAAYERLQRRPEPRLLLSDMEEQYNGYDSAAAVLTQAAEEFPYVVEISLAKGSLEFRRNMCENSCCTQYNPGNKWRSLYHEAISKFTELGIQPAVTLLIGSYVRGLTKTQNLDEVRKFLLEQAETNKDKYILHMRIQSELLYLHKCDPSEYNDVVNTLEQLYEEALNCNSQYDIETKRLLWHHYVEFLIEHHKPISKLRKAKSQARRFFSLNKIDKA